MSYTVFLQIGEMTGIVTGPEIALERSGRSCIRRAILQSEQRGADGKEWPCRMDSLAIASLMFDCRTAPPSEFPGEPRDRI